MARSVPGSVPDRDARLAPFLVRVRAPVDTIALTSRCMRTLERRPVFPSSHGSQRAGSGKTRVGRAEAFSRRDAAGRAGRASPERAVTSATTSACASSRTRAAILVSKASTRAVMRFHECAQGVLIVPIATSRPVRTPASGAKRRVVAIAQETCDAVAGRIDPGPSLP